MGNVMKASLYKLFKSKSFYVLLAVAAALTLFMVGMYKILDSLPMPDEFADVFGLNGKMIYLMCFSLGNGGFVVALAAALVVGYEFQHGTVRNSLVSGVSRPTYYCAQWLTALVSGTLILLGTVVVALLFGVPLLGWGAPFNGAEFGDFMRTLALGVLMFVVIETCVVFITFLAKSLIMGIVGTVVLVMFGQLLPSLEMLVPFGNEKVADLIHDLLMCTVFGQLNYLMQGSASLQFHLSTLISSTVVIGGLMAGGIALFKRADLK